MKQVPLPSGLFALVDDEDFDRVMRFRWHAKPSSRTTYVKREVQISDEPRIRKAFTLHRFITDAPEGFEVDHRDGDGLNCQKKNLRVCLKSKNHLNQGMRTNNDSGFKGVAYRTDNGMFRAYINVEKIRLNLGQFTKPEDAAQIYDAVAVLFHGEFARTNRQLGLLS